MPLKVAFVNGDLLLEAHPPVDAQGQSVEPVLNKFEALLNEVLGSSITAINWDIAVETLKKANGIPVLVGVQADEAPPAATPAAPAGPATPAPTVTTQAAPAAPADPDANRWVNQ